MLWTIDTQNSLPRVLADLQTPTVSLRDVTKTSDTNNAGSTARNSAQRDELTRDLVAVLGKFAQSITEVSSLKLQKDSLQRNLDRRNADYEKSRRHFADFPAAAEAQNVALRKTQKDIEVVNRQLEEKQSGFNQIIERFAEKMVPNHQGPLQSDDRQYRELKDRVDSIESRQERFNTTQESFSEKLDDEHKKWSEAQASWG
jgi:vacuolar-type H+-ATPase subunit I/STV1